MKRLIVCLCLAGLAWAASAQGQRLRVDIGCQPTEAALTFLCTIDLSDAAGRPVDGAEVTLSADMPSMPMAHNVRPAKVEPVVGRPGRYQGRLTLEMLGEWAVKARLEGPRPDVVVRKLDFQKDKVSPAGTR